MSLEDFKRIYEDDYEEYHVERLIRGFKNIDIGGLLIDNMHNIESDGRTEAEHLAEKIKTQIRFLRKEDNVTALYNYIQNFEEYNKIIFRNIVRNVNKYASKIYENFKTYLPEGITQQLFIYILLKWFEELNKEGGLLDYDIQQILETDGENFAITDSGPRDRILLMSKEYV